MADKVMRYRPRVASLSTPEAADRLRTLLKERGCADMPDIVHGPEGIVEAATVSTADTVVTGIVGAAGLLPTIEAIKLGKDIALANKETLISGGPVINPLVEKHGINMLPADSEHSAIFQCLQGVPPGGLRRIILTASGGAFRDLTKEELFSMCEADKRAEQAHVRGRQEGRAGEGDDASQLGHGGEDHAGQRHDDEQGVGGESRAAFCTIYVEYHDMRDGLSCEKGSHDE